MFLASSQKPIGPMDVYKETLTLCTTPFPPKALMKIFEQKDELIPKI
jgi:hypothetical protein